MNREFRMLSGQLAPVTSDRFQIVEARNARFTVFVSGSAGGAIDFQYESPFFQNDWVNFYTLPLSSTGYQTPIFLDTPMEEIRANVTGSTGYCWLAARIQD